MIDHATRALVRQRAGDRCEYCLLPQWAMRGRTFHVEHVVARQHGGSDDPDNLALACDRCNYHKGPNVAAIDPASGSIVPLFHPRRADWRSHFTVSPSMEIVGRTDVGRATAKLLNMNAPGRVQLRKRFGLTLPK